ncbi:MAG: YihY/virulence factor BrkB family protein [Chlamydiales bacterium]|nr:YihY/virulence factor BrkB family protein [Chlamydiales bacterium]
MKIEWIQNLKKEIWRTDLQSLPKFKANWIRFLRVTILVSQGFTKMQIQQGASALTYYSLLALVPILALLMGIARGFGLEEALEKWLIEQFVEQKFIINQIFEFARTSLETAHQGVIAGIGILLLLWAGIKIFMYIEANLNFIWEVKGERSLARRFTDYLAMLLLFPIIVLLSSGITVYLSATVTALMEGGFLEKVGVYLVPLLNLIPYVLICLLFTFLYIFMPNTHVRFLPALWAGIIAGSIYQLVQWAYLYFQIGVTGYNAIYGTFAALPLLLIWIHLSWVIILLGAKISFAFQNVNAFDFLTEDVHLSHRFRMILSLRITHLSIKSFLEEELPPSAIEVSNKLSIPLPLTSHLLYQLAEAGVLSKVKRDRDEEVGFQPARNLDKLTIKSVIDMINARGEEIPLPSSPEIDLILKSLDEFDRAINESDGNAPLKDFV